MNEKLKIVQRMKSIADEIAQIEEKIKKLSTTDVRYVDSVIIEYAEPIDRKYPDSTLTEKYGLGKVVFTTPNGRNAEKIVDYIKRVYESELEAHYQALNQCADMLKENALSSATNTEQGNETR